MIGGLFDSAGKLDVWKGWGWDKSHSDGENVAAARDLHNDFLRTFNLVIDAINDWRDLPHPPILGRRHASRQWGVLSMSFRSMVTAIDYEYTAFSVALFGEGGEKEAALNAVGSGVTVFASIRLGLDQTLAGRVGTLEEVMGWSEMMMRQNDRLERFGTEYAMRGAQLRAEAGLGMSS